jgi:Ca2+/H+ antiporter
MNEVFRAGAGLEANFNLVVQLGMGVALIAGALFARAKRYTAHGICQAAVLLLNLIMIAFVMLPSFYGQVMPALPETSDRGILRCGNRSRYFGRDR